MKPERLDVDAVLQSRARELAIRDEGESVGAVEAFASFSIGGYVLAAPLGRVTRASEMRHLTEIPNGPPYLVGITAVEGHLVSLLDVPVLLDMQRHGVGDVTASLVVACGSREIGLAAEQLLGIEDVRTDRITILPGASGPIWRMAARGQLEIMLLDIDRLFADPRLALERR